MVLARSWALTAVTVFLAVWLHRQEQTVRHQGRECCDEAEAKRGPQRPALAVDPCGVPLRRWVLRGWPGTQLALALDATTWGLRLTVLAISVVSRGGAMPVAWTIVAANPPQAGRRAGLRRLRQLRPAMPRAWPVSGLADRGLDAGWWVRRIVRLGWHPCWRLKAGGPFRPDPQATDRPWPSFVPRPGRRGRGTGTAFKSPQRRLRCTLLAGWEEGYTAPWVMLTDVPPAASEAGWDGVQAWIEQGLKVTKRAGSGHAPA
jgi:hypothetical protein